MSIDSKGIRLNAYQEALGKETRIRTQTHIQMHVKPSRDHVKFHLRKGVTQISRARMSSWEQSSGFCVHVYAVI